MIKVNKRLIPIKKRFANEYNLSKVLNELGNPEKNIPTINVVGTNGKGSTSFYLSKALLSKYKKVGLFISPAFLYQNERIQINNEYISDKNLKLYLKKVRTYIRKYKLTFFEIWTLIMILYFSDNKIDIAVIEAGIGGIKDATNLMNNQILTLLTSVSFDHTEILGNSIDEIIDQKIGIVKDDIPIIISNDNYQYKKIINKKDLNIIWAKDYLDDKSYQKGNKGLVQKAMEYLKLKNFEILNLTPPLGRLTVLSNNPLFIIDGAHNTDGILQLINSMKLTKRKVIILFASSNKKDYKQNLKLLDDNFKYVYITQFRHFKSWKIKVVNHGNKVKNWKKFLLENRDINILVCGSLYFIPQVYEWYIKNKKKMKLGKEEN